MNFSERFLELRKQNGYSQEEIGYKLNVARQTISKWESGVTTPDMENLIKISQLFNISIDELIGNKLVSEDKESSSKAIKEDKQVIENVNIKKKKSRLKKVLKIIAIIVLLLVIISLIYWCKVVYDRYNLLTRVYLNYSNFHYKDMKNFDYYSHRIISEASRTKENTSVQAYRKGDKFKIMYFTTNVGKKDNPIIDELVRIEYTDKDEYYDIDVINKTYAKDKYVLDKDFNYNSTISEMEYKLDYKLYLSSAWNRVFLAFNYFYKIYVREINGGQDIIIEPRYMMNYKDNIQVRASYLCNSAPYIHYSMETYIDNKNISEGYDWYLVEDEYAKDWQVELPDLTEYTLIEK